MDQVGVSKDKAKAKTKAKKVSFFKGLETGFKKIVWLDKITLAKQTVAVVSISVVLGAIIAVVDILVKYGIDLWIR